LSVPLLFTEEFELGIITAVIYHEWSSSRLVGNSETGDMAGS